jgi:hypothetical protein
MLDERRNGTFAFAAPATARGQELSVVQVEWLTPVSLGVVGGPVPMWSIVLVVLAGAVLMRRGMLVKG